MNFALIEQQTIILSKFVWQRMVEIVKAPTLNFDMLWILIPLLATIFLIELYFGMHRQEKLGWNSAVGNSLVLFFVGMNLFSWLYRNKMLIGIMPVENTLVSVAMIKTFIALFVVIESIFLLIINFFHLLPQKFSFGISSPLILNFIGVICIILVYSKITLDYITAIASIILFVGFVLFFNLLKLIIPKTGEMRKFVYKGREIYIPIRD